MALLSGIDASYRAKFPTGTEPYQQFPLPPPTPAQLAARQRADAEWRAVAKGYESLAGQQLAEEEEEKRKSREAVEKQGVAHPMKGRAMKQMAKAINRRSPGRFALNAAFTFCGDLMYFTPPIPPKRCNDVTFGSFFIGKTPVPKKM